MVKNLLALISMGILGSTLIMTGCNQSTPAYPKDMSSLVLKVPIPSSGSAGVSASTVYLSYGVLRYHITSGTEIINGAINLDLGTKTLGQVNIPLPHNGTWLVSAEWFEGGYYSATAVGDGNPRFVGADQVVVNGTTNFTLLMGDITLNGCSYEYLADVNSCVSGYYGDIFNFDTAQITFSGSYAAAVGSATDEVQVFYDSSTGTEYIGPGPGSRATFAYLGTGDWVNYTNIPAGTKYYSTTQEAKAAVVGTLIGKGDSTIAYNDVYLVRLSETSHIWFQVLNLGYCGGGGYVGIGFRENNQGFPYMKYQATTYGLANCTNLYFYQGGGG